MENQQVIVTKHASQRLKERSGLNKKSIQRIADKVYKDGIRINETTGNLNRWMRKILHKSGSADEIIAYGDKVFILKGQVYITVLQIPPNITKNMGKMCKKHSC